MIGPYKMVLINLILSVLICICVYVYKYVFPKKKITLFFLLIIISFLALVRIFRAGTYESGDLSINAIKTMEMYNSFLEGNFFPQWAGNLNATYGYPMFIFAYPLPYYIASFFYFLGLSFINSIKALLFFSFVLSGITMYLWIKQKIGKLPAFVSSLFYLFAPYHLIDVHFRVDIGETLAFVFIPLVFLLIDKIFIDKKIQWIFLSAVSICFLILSHQAISLFVFIILCFYILFYYLRQKNIKALFLSLESLILGLLLSMFYWLPVIYLLKYTHPSVSSDISYPVFWEFFFSSWRYGLLFQGPIGQLSPIVGYIQWIVIVISIVFIFKKIKFEKEISYLIKFSIITFFIIFLIMQSFSKFFWDVLPFLKNIQFTSRLLSIEAFFTAILAGIVVWKINKKTFTIIICVLVISTTVLNWGNRRVIPEITDQVLKQQLPLSTAAGEGLGPAAPKWTDLKNVWMNKVPKKKLEILEGEGKVTEIMINNTNHVYKVIANDSLLLKENTLYFPGWEVRNNNIIIPISYQNRKYPGIITFRIPKGENLIEVCYKNTNIVKFSKIISLITLLFIVLFFIKSLLFPKLKI